MNTTHRVHHLSFGHHLLTAEGGASQQQRDRLLEKLLDRGHNPINLNLVEQPFVMPAPNATWEHFLRVVPEVRGCVGAWVRGCAGAWVRGWFGWWWWVERVAALLKKMCGSVWRCASQTARHALRCVALR